MSVADPSKLPEDFAPLLAYAEKAVVDYAKYPVLEGLIPGPISQSRAILALAEYAAEQQERVKALKAEVVRLEDNTYSGFAADWRHRIKADAHTAALEAEVKRLMAEVVRLEANPPEADALNGVAWDEGVYKARDDE